MKKRKLLIDQQKGRWLALMLTLLLLPVAIQAEDYGITVGGIQVTSENASNVMGDGTVTYTHNAADNSGILTLSGATLAGNIEVNAISALTIKVAGQNVINAGSASAIQSNVGTNAVALAFVKEGTGDCSLELNSTEFTVISTGFSEPTYTDLALAVDGVEYPEYYSLYGLAYYAGNDVYSPITSATITSYETYDIIVSGETVTNLNKDNICKGTVGSGHILFDGDHTLTLNNVPNMVFDGSYPFIQTSMDLTINLVGINEFDCGQNIFITRMEGDNDTHTLTFTTDADHAGSLFLTAGNQFDGFEAVYQNGLEQNPDGYYDPEAENKPVLWIAQASLGLKVGGIVVTQGNSSDILGNGNGSVSYNSTTHTLTLNGATITGNISTTLENLTINLEGLNTLNGCITNSQAYEYTSLSFTGDGSLGITGDGVFNDIESYELASGLYLASDFPAPYCDGSLRGADGNEVSSITISANETYPVWVYTGAQLTGYTQLTATNPSVNGTNGTASYNGNILTLTDFECTTTDGGPAFYIGQEIGNLTVYLSGNSTTTGGGFYFCNYDATLTFTKGETDGSFEVQDGEMATCNDGFPSIACENGLVLNDRTVSTGGIRIDIADNPFTESGSLYDGKVTFDASTNTLTLSDGATIGSAAASSDITVYVDHLIVELDGESRLYGNIQYVSANQSSSIQIDKADGATSANLTLSDVVGFGSCTWGDGLYLSAHDAQGATIDVHYEHYEGEGGAMQSYYGEIADVTFSTTGTNAIWVAGNMSMGGNITGEGIEGTVIYNADDRILTLENASISTSENYPSPLIVCNGDLTVNLVESNNTYFNGYYGTYIFKNNDSTGTLTFTGTGSLVINTDYDEGTYIGLCDGFSTVDFGDLAYTINGDWKAISPLNISIPMMNVFEGKIEFITNGYLFGSTTYYKIVYADGDGNGEEVPLTNSDFNNYNEKITISELTGPCTVYAYTKYNTETGDSAKAKLFGSNPSPFRLVWGADPVDLVLTPAIEEDDGITINGIEASVNYDSETGKVSSEIMGSLSGPVSMSETEGETVILNNYFSMEFEVVPPAPTVSLEAGSYLATHDPITLTGTGVANTTIMYQWNDGNAEEYAEAIPVQAGTLMAWEMYSDGTSIVVGDTTTVVYTLSTDLGITFASGQSWATYYATESLTVPEGLTAYVVSSVDATNGTVATEQIDYIPMNKAVLLKHSEGAPLSGFGAAPYTGEESTVTNLLQGTAEGISVGSITNGTVYVLYNDCFTRATKGIIPANRGYLLLTTEPQQARLAIIEDSESTGIAEMEQMRNVGNETFYNLNGQRVDVLQKNKLYIVNGKKTIIK